MNKYLLLNMCFLAALPAMAQNDYAQKLAALEQRMEALETVQPAASRLEAVWKPGLVLSSPDQSIQMHIGGRVQNDWSFLSGDKVLEEKNDLSDTVDFRRIWLEWDGTLYGRTYYAAHLDFAGGKTGVRNLYIGLKEVPALGRVQVGSQQEPFGLEELTSNNNLTFLERALALFYPSYNAGVRFLRTLADQWITVSGGLFRETDDAGRLSSDDGYSATARLTANPLASEDGRIVAHLGAAGSFRRMPDGTAQFRGRPDNRWAPYFVSLTNIPADEVALVGLEVATVLGPFSLQAEWNMATPDTDGADPGFSGYYAQISYFLTGEHRPYDRNTGTFGRVVPAHPFGNNGWGAWEAALRYSTVDLNDGDYLGGEMDNITAGLNWYLNPNVKMMFNYVRSDLDAVGEADAILARFQVAF